MKLIRALFISNGWQTSKDGPVVSGGDVRWLEIAKQWQRLGIEIHILTQKTGREFCIKMDLQGEIYYHFMPFSEEYGRIGSIRKVFNSFKIPNELRSFDGTVYSTTEIAYDVIPGFLIKRKNPRCSFVVVAHWVAPLRRKGNSFLNALMFFLGQRLGYLIAKRHANLILAVSRPTKEVILQKIKVPEEIIRVVNCGIDYRKIREIASQRKEKLYEGIFMKRLEATKGVFEVISIWKEVLKECPFLKLILVGNSTEKTRAKLAQIIKDESLQQNVIINGPIYEFEQKIRTLMESKLFLLPSHEENWAIVVGEALACGTPVICYELQEIKPIWEDKIMWVQKEDKRGFATSILALLNDNHKQEMMEKIGVEFVKKYDWKQIAEDELNLIVDNARTEAE
jgi:glycosyltransferase involved in cell wall biosynthesis